MNRYIAQFLGILVLAVSAAASADDGIYIKNTSVPVDIVYKEVSKALEEKRFWIVFEANIGENLKGFADKWGEDYNRNGLTAIRSLVVCNGWWANAVSNADPEMLALCPLRVNLTQRDEVTSVLFARPTIFASESPAKPVLTKIEERIIEAIGNGVAAAENKVPANRPDSPIQSSGSGD